MKNGKTERNRTDGPGRKKPAALTAGLVCLLLFLTAAGVLSGAEPLSVREICSFAAAAVRGEQYDPFVKILVVDLRLPRTITALLCGALLASAGAVFQGLFRNDLADPYIMGVSSGATFGAVLASILPLSIAASGAAAVFSFCGAMGTVMLVYAIAGKNRRMSGTAGLLLAGTAVSAFLSAVNSFLLITHDSQLYKIYFWTMGSLSGATWRNTFFLLAAALPAYVCFFFCSRALDLLSSGETAAQSMGLNTEMTRLFVMAAGALATAAATAAAGMIGFVGLTAPHIARIMCGFSHRRLIFTSALTGAALLLAADILSRIVIRPAELPVGIITAVTGAPFFIWLLISRGARRS